MDLYKNYDHMEYDGLVTDTLPEVIVTGGTLKKGSTAATLKRGTILSKESDGKLVTLGSGTGTAYAILCDDTAVGTAADVKAPIYIAGCFDLAKCVVAQSHTVSEAEKDALRNGGIIFKAPQTM